MPGRFRRLVLLALAALTVSLGLVGNANAQNPIALIIPCHRVIGADGSLTGYGGGLSRKRWLLAHESRQGELLP